VKTTVIQQTTTTAPTQTTTVTAPTKTVTAPSAPTPTTPTTTRCAEDDSHEFHEHRPMATHPDRVMRDRIDAHDNAPTSRDTPRKDQTA
jgi:hypothetical protein